MGHEGRGPRGPSSGPHPSCPEPQRSLPPDSQREPVAIVDSPVVDWRRGIVEEVEGGLVGEQVGAGNAIEMFAFGGLVVDLGDPGEDGRLRVAGCKTSTGWIGGT